MAAGLLALPAGAAAQDAAEAKVALQYVASPEALAAFTPAKALEGGCPFTMRGDTGSLNVAGTDVKFAIRWSEPQQAFYAGLDLNGNGFLDGGEWAQMAQSGMVTFANVQAGDKKHIVRIANMRTTVRTTGGGGILGSTGGYTIAGFYQGLYQGTPIRIFDDNLDGKITQDGKDAIQVGRSGVAIPLRKFHQIGSQHCSLAAAEDGSSVTITPLAGEPLGIVDSSYKRGLKVLALVDDQGRSYDLAASGRTGIPAGKYKLAYGVLADSSAFTVIKPTDKCPVYEIQAGKINTIRIGAPLWVMFSASVNAGNVTVSPVVRIFGAAYEEYTFDFSGVGPGRPNVLLIEGQTILNRIPMSYG